VYRNSVAVKKRKAPISAARPSTAAAAAAAPPDQAAPPARQCLRPKSSSKKPKSTSAPYHGAGSSPGAEIGLSSPPILDEKTTPTKKMTKRDGVQTGHKLCRGCGGEKITVPSSDEDSDYSDEKQPSDGSVDVPVTPLKEKKRHIVLPT